MSFDLAATAVAGGGDDVGGLLVEAAAESSDENMLGKFDVLKSPGTCLAATGCGALLGCDARDVLQHAFAAVTVWP